MIYYIRNTDGELLGLKYNNQLYYYKKNYQQDIIGIYNSSYEEIVKYKYDSWGNIISITDNNNQEITDVTNIGLINLFRYRSYYYDTETNLYYLNSRYYNPEWGRFINADIMISKDKHSKNLFAYCDNNPVTRIEVDGASWIFIGAVSVAAGIVSAGAKAVSNVVHKKKALDGVISAFVGTTAGTFVTMTTGSVTNGALVAASVTALIDGYSPYINGFAQANGKKKKDFTAENFKDTADEIITDSAIGTVKNIIASNIAGKFIPTNKGWFQPQKLVTTVKSKYFWKTVFQDGISEKVNNTLSKAEKGIKKLWKKIFK